jgi:hypothetical protein
MKKFLVSMIALAMIACAVPAKADNSEEVAIGILGGVIGGMVLGEILDGHGPDYPPPVYPAYEVPPPRCWYKHIQVWDEEFQQYILVKKRVCSQY